MPGMNTSQLETYPDLSSETPDIEHNGSYVNVEDPAAFWDNISVEIDTEMDEIGATDGSS